MVVHTFNLSTQKRLVHLCELKVNLKASLVYRSSSRTAKTKQRNPVLSSAPSKKKCPIASSHVHKIGSCPNGINLREAMEFPMLDIY